MNMRFTEGVALLAHKAGTVTSTQLATLGVKAHLSFRFFALLALLSDMASETIDVRIEKCSAADGTGAAELKAATQLAAHATNNDNKAIWINLRSDELDDALPFIRGRAVTGNVTGGICSLSLFGMMERWGPITDFDVSTIVEIVS